MKRLLVLVALILVPKFAAAQGSKVAVGDLTQGRRLFSLHCASCHGFEGRGGGNIVTMPAAPELVGPERMTLMSDAQIFALIDKGGPALDKSEMMPAFGTGLSDLDMWDLVAFLRSQHLTLTDFYPDAAAFFGNTYTIDKWGAERHQALTRVSLPKDQAYTVLGVYQGTQPPSGPRLIPDTPLELAKVDRKSKVGYVVFVAGTLPGVQGEQILGVSMSNSGIVWKVLANTKSPKVRAQLARVMERWEGYGDKGMKTAFEGRGKKERQIAKAWTEIYSRAMEAAVMFDKAERERHWADSEFGGPADPEASVEGGILKVDQGKKKKRKRRR